MAKRKRNETNPEVETSQDGFSEPESGPANSEKKITVRRESGKVIVSVPVRFYRRNGRQMILAEGEASIGRITLKEEFCLEAIELARKFFADVLAAVPDEMIP